MMEAQELYQQLLEFGESARIEAKRGSQISDAVMQSVCAFANEPGLQGGYILLRINESDAQYDSYYVCDVNNGDIFERTVIDDAYWEDLNPEVIALYHHLRAQARPKAEELKATDEEKGQACVLHVHA